MVKEWRWRSKSGRSALHAGIGSMDAVGAQKPSDAIPMQEGLRLLIAKGIDRWWLIICIAAFIRRITKRKGRKHR